MNVKRSVATVYGLLVIQLIFVGRLYYSQHFITGPGFESLGAMILAFLGLFITAVVSVIVNVLALRKDHSVLLYIPLCINVTFITWVIAGTVHSMFFVR